MLHLLLWDDKYFTRRQSVWLRCFCWNNWMWILFFWASIQIHSPASREAVMNNYFTLSNHLSALAVYRPRELAWLCCLLVYEQHFCLEVSTAVCFFFFFPVSGVWSRPDDDAATSSPRAETAVSYSATEFSATVGEFIKALLQNKNIHSLFCLWDLALLCYTTCIWIS